MELIITGEITPETTKQFERLEGEVKVRLNSPGGDVFEALTIYNRLKNHDGSVEVIVEGLCASAATVVACGGRCAAYENALFMMHNPLMELNGAYPSEELSSRLRMLQAVESELVKVYVGKTGKTEDEIREALRDETWFTALEARRFGLVDEIIPLRATVENKGDVVIINDVRVKASRYKKGEELKRMSEMSNETLLERIKAYFGRSERETALESEVARLKEELKEAQSKAKTNEMIYALIEDQLKSGAGGVKASVTEVEDGRRLGIKQVIEYGNRRRQK